MHTTRQLLIALALCQAAALAVGQTPTATGSVAAAPAYRCGGIGKDESEAMKAQASRHSLFLMFSASSGAYVADVDVEIRRAGGAAVLQALCDGPMMLVDLAPGRYQVRANYGGQAQTRNVTVGAGTARQSFVWRAAAGNGPETLR